MIWEIPENLKLWQLVATIMVAQNQTGPTVAVSTQNAEHRSLLSACGVPVTTAPGTTVMPYSDVELILASCQGMTQAYPEALAVAMNLKVPTRIHPPTREEALVGMKPVIEPILDLTVAWNPPAGSRRGIVVCPYTFLRELELPISAWHAIITMLRTFGEPVYLMCGPGQRFDSGKFSENEIIAEETVLEKLAVLRNASLIVGVPNEWTWLATAWKKPTVYFYPDSIPSRRWFWNQHEYCGRCAFTPGTEVAQTPLILAGMRMLINGF